METLKQALEKIETPLRFSAGNDFRNLTLVRNLEEPLRKKIAGLRDVLPQKVTDNQRAGRMAMRLAALDGILSGFDAASPEDRKRRISEGLACIDALKGELAGSGDADGRAVPQGVPREALASLETAVEKLTRPAQFVKGVGPKIGRLLERKGLKTVEDLLLFLPRKYEDRRDIKPIARAEAGRKETVVGTVVRADIQPYRKRKVFEAVIRDDSAALKAKWFKGSFAYLRNVFKPGCRVILTGEMRVYRFEPEMIHPDYEILEEGEEGHLHFKRIVPIYSETEGLGQKHLRRILLHAVEDYARYMPGPIPREICERQGLIDIIEAVRAVHFPGPEEDVNRLNAMRSEGHRRLIFDELFYFELAMALKHAGNVLDEGIAFKTGGELTGRFLSILPFGLTAAQSRVIAEIQGDMARPSPMHRLLQGDVGSGKTVVSMAAMLTACENGYQAALMAPTEILAEQHHRNVGRWAESLGLKTALLLGGLRSPEKREIARQIEAGEVHIVVGTHALIQEGVDFRKLGLVVVDEQHRFGVVQRATLRAKGANPDVLVMTATPIPRTLAMTVYGDLDISVIDEMPPGKKPVRTKVFYERERPRVYEIIRKEIAKSNQVFIVYPLVSESEALDLKDATRMAEHLQRDVFPELRVGLIHGRMKAQEKERIMQAFNGRALDILVATTVIEVGIDIPRASLMVIEHAERFGLAQLHQLRGRVGRSDIPSYCILMTGSRGSENARKRLGIMEQTQDGFRIAEADLEIRGPGEMMGTRQSGIPDFRVADILRDGRLLGDARAEAFELVKKDPRLQRPEHALLREVLLWRWESRLDLARTG
ncbi:MAG TPA: ATP-dependent DNA helicase RecG [Syntrophales bacterium]|nr:ATP-dependent DNA helicase RecG [Syntrophales bacterium]HNS53166.1 ATP-dependent DNA helicase RecG [Syntrophales bacterium]